MLHLMLFKHWTSYCIAETFLCSILSMTPHPSKWQTWDFNALNFISGSYDTRGSDWTIARLMFAFFHSSNKKQKSRCHHFQEISTLQFAMASFATRWAHTSRGKKKYDFVYLANCFKRRVHLRGLMLRPTSAICRMKITWMLLRAK